MQRRDGLKNLLGSSIGWVIGALIGVFIISLWTNGEVDWGHFVCISLGGLIGTIIGFGIIKVVKVTKKENRE